MSRPEEWRPVVGLEGRYEVSDQGRVRSLIHCHGLRPSPKIRRQFPNSRGYLTVWLSNGSAGRHFLVHQLVTKAFHGARPSALHESSHRDGDHINNGADNLRWLPSLENQAERETHRRLRREPHHRRKVTPELASRILTMLATMTGKEVAQKVGLSRTAVSHVKHGKWEAAREAQLDRRRA